MNILVVANVMPRAAATALNLPAECCGGWVQSLIEQLPLQRDISLSVCYMSERAVPDMEVETVRYFAFPAQRRLYSVDASTEQRLGAVINTVKPDVLHIFGTEFPHTLAAVRAFAKPEKTVIHIQGLVSVYSEHYMLGLPYSVCVKSTFRDLLRQDNISQQAAAFRKRGILEVEAIQSVKHIMGRTDWDAACAKQINPSATYYYVQETMRSSFYESEWRPEAAQKHSVFMSQGGYPVKGLHLALKALRQLKEVYPDVKLYVAGCNPCDFSDIGKTLRRTEYAAYLARLIREGELEESICFTGSLSEEQMKEQYLKCSAFLSPSVIENSPNSVGEAMLLGVPVVASDVGGVSSLIEHRRNGFLYPADEPYMAAYYIEKLFENSETARQIGQNAVQTARARYDREKIINEIVSVYRSMEK